MTDEQRAKQIERLEAKRAASQGRDGYAARIAMIDAQFAALRS